MHASMPGVPHPPDPFVPPPSPVPLVQNVMSAPPSNASNVDAPQVSSPPPSATPGVSEVHAQPASLWRRLLASAIDAAAIGAVVFAYLAVASAIVGHHGPATQMTGLDGLMARAHALERVLIPGIVLAVILALAYSAAFGVIWDGRTPGRRLTGIRLVDSSGLAPAPARAVVRALLSVFSALIFLGGFWLALFDRKGQTLHDKLTSTFVIRPRPT